MVAARGEPCADGLYISNFADLIVLTSVNAYPPLISDSSHFTYCLGINISISKSSIGFIPNLSNAALLSRNIVLTDYISQILQI